jgi:hypothetical protein
MRDLALQCAGIAAIVVAILHGMLGEKRIFAHATIQPAQIRTMLRLVWQCSTVAWLSSGVLLFVTPQLASDPVRHWIVATAAATYGFAAVANAIATRGKHVGWVALTAVTALALVGY